jgi:4-hydroxybutyrate CoA-transferase
MRRDFSVDWRAHYDSRLTSPVGAAAKFSSGDHIWIPPLHGSPAILAALAARAPELRGVEIRALGVPDVGLWAPEALEAFHYADQFGNPFSRPALDSRLVDYHPYWLVGGHKGLDAGRADAWRIDKCLITVGPPDACGYVCVGGSVWDSLTSARRAACVIAAVNPAGIETFGDTRLHVSEIDCFVIDDRQIEVPTRVYDAVDEGLAHYVGSLVQDGDTVQIGTGSHTAGMVHYGLFRNRRDLSYFGELTVAGLVPLVAAGVFTGSRSALHPGKFVATLIGNTPEERASVHRNPAFELYGIDYILDPRTIARNEAIVAINGALTIDLTGQSGAYSIGPRIYAGMGGHLAFAIGAYLAPRGRFVSVMPSTAAGGTVSTITPQSPSGQFVSVPRELADTVVTEYGVARLLGKTVRQRAEELIAIAHPDFRGELRNASRSLFYP